MDNGQPAHLAGWPCFPWRESHSLEAAAGRGWRGSTNRPGRPAQRGRTGRGKRSAQRQRRTTGKTSGGARRGPRPQRPRRRSGARERTPAPPLKLPHWGRQPDGGGGARGGEGASRRGFATDKFAARRPDAALTACAGRRACARPPTGSTHPVSAAAAIDQAAGQAEPTKRARRRSSQRARPVSAHRMSPTW